VKQAMSVHDAVDGSSTGTRVPWMWTLLRLPRLRGQNRFGQTGAALTTVEVNNLVAEPDVLLLLMFLKANNGPASEFMVANGLSEGGRLPLTRKALAAARNRLIALGYIHQTRAASGGWNNVPALYRWKNKKAARGGERHTSRAPPRPRPGNPGRRTSRSWSSPSPISAAIPNRTISSMA
jgi:hypothetical protein